MSDDKIDSSELRHMLDKREKLGHKAVKSADGSGGACLNRHGRCRSPKEGEGITCAYRWQAYKRMESDSVRYNYPAYQSLCGNTSRFRTFKWGTRWPRYYSAFLDPPTKNSWDLGNSTNWRGRTYQNFWEKCYAPYYHEAHHVIANSALRDAIEVAGRGKSDPPAVVRQIRSGLLQEGYNLNFNNNMIMLPLDKPVSKAIKLPRHRHTSRAQNHWAYNKLVMDKLKPILSKVSAKIDGCKEEVDYEALKTDIENESKNLYTDIVNSVAGASISLDDIARAQQ